MRPSSLRILVPLLATSISICSCSDSAPGGNPGDETGGSATSMSGSGGSAGTGTPGSGSGGATAGSSGVGGSGGSAGSGALGGFGGTGQPTAACALTADRVRITSVEVGVEVVHDENWGGDSLPIMISAMPSGGSRVGFYGSDNQVHVVTLDANDALVAGGSITISGNDFVDLHADDTGGYVLLNRDSTGGGHLNCGTFLNLCGNESSHDQAEPNACWDMYLVRFDGAATTWATQLTDANAQEPAYRSSTTADGWQTFIWASGAYPHRGRIASNGTNVAAYYGVSIAVSEACVQADSILETGINIHQGDRLTVVDTGGNRVDEESTGVGCSHSFYQDVVWDPSASRFVAVCMTDNQNRLSLGQNYSTIRSLVEFDEVNMDGLVLGVMNDYWLATSDGESAGDDNANVYLLRFSVTGDEAMLLDTVDLAAAAGVNERAPHLAAYGTDGLLAGWETGDDGGDFNQNDDSRQLHVQVRDRATGAAIGDALPVDVQGNQFHAFRSFPDGSVAYAAPGDTPTSVKILRILPCPG